MVPVQCITCFENFEISPEDEQYYRKREIPIPKMCPKHRMQRLLMFRNERKLFRRKSDKTGREIIANIRPESPYPVFHYDEWHQDDWNAPFLPKYDFSKGFFEQFKNLSLLSPRQHGAFGGNAVNSEYINHAGNCKNCYYIFNSEYDEDCMYTKLTDHSRDCVDVTNCFHSELCYDCVNVERCYNVIFSDDCKDSRDSAFVRNCRRVQNCLFCYGLEGAEYHIFNQPVSKEEFEQKREALKLNTFSGLMDALRSWENFSKQFPLRRKIIQNCENSSGDSLYNCKNALDCYNCSGLQDCRYAINTVDTKDSYDVYAYGMSELCTNCVTIFHSYNMKFCVYAIQSNSVEYCDTIWGCNDCFGCVGLRKKNYCIFNKQYSKEEYFDLVKRIKEKMIADGEYGEFFPEDFSVFPYEDSMAQDYFPREVASRKKPEGIFLETSLLPDDVNSVDIPSIMKNAYRCPVTDALFAFQKQELDFYKKIQVPIPRVSFEARYKRRNQFVPFPY